MFYKVPALWSRRALCTAALFVAPHLAMAQNAPTALPSGFYPFDINNKGQIAGVTWAQKPGCYQGAVYDLNTRKLTKLKSKHTCSDAYAINDAGDVYGSTCRVTRVDGELTCGGFKAAIWTAKKLKKDPKLLAKFHSIEFANDAAEYVAKGRGSFDDYIVVSSRSQHAVSSNSQTFDSAIVSAFNNAGTVVGRLASENGNSAAFVFRDGALSLLPVPQSTLRSSAEAVNDQGAVVGTLRKEGESLYEGVIWRSGNATSLGQLEGLQASYTPTDINNRGQVVGNAALLELDKDGYRKSVLFLYDEAKGMRRLADLVPAVNALNLTFVTKLNDRGELLASNGDGEQFYVIKLP